MQLIQTGFSCEYEMNIFMKMFFDKSENVSVFTDFSYENETIHAAAKIEYNGKNYTAEYSYKYKKKNKRADKIVSRCFVVRAFCDAAQNIKRVSIPWGALSGIRPAKVVRQMKESGMTTAEIKNELKNVFGVEEKKIRLALEVAENETEILSGVSDDSISVYIGIPFCPSKCLYCSFVSSDLRTGKKYVDEYVRLLDKEIEKTAEVIKKLGFYIENIYIGGGTPTSISNEQLRAVLSSVKRYFDLSKIKEYTLEAGRADTITREKLETAKAFGVDRISINPQTMNDITLERVGRRHSAQMVRDTFLLARDVGFDNINMDLIAGLPGENFDMFKYSLDEVVELDPEDVTVHSLCIKRAAAFRFSDYDLTDSDEMNKMLDYTQMRMRETNRSPYYMYRQKNISGNLENVGYTKPGCYSFYNVNIMEEVQNIIAVGGGGASKIVMGDRIERVFNFKDPYEYIRRFDEILQKKDEFFEIYNEMQVKL